MEYPAEFWNFDNTQLIDVPGEDGYLVTPLTDILLIKTGYELFRNESLYWQYTPGLTPKLAVWLREKHPDIRALLAWL